MRILVLFLGLSAATLGWADTATVVDGTRVNLRSGKTDTYRVIKALEPGTELEVLHLERAYVQVKTDEGEVGWLPLRFVNINKSVDSASNKAATAAPATAPKPDPNLQELREQIQRAQQELKQSQLSEPAFSWGIIAAVGAGGLLLGVLLGMAGLQAYYRKRLHGLRI